MGRTDEGYLGEKRVALLVEGGFGGGRGGGCLCAGGHDGRN